MLLAGPALTEEDLQIAGRIAGKTGCGLKREGANARLARGAGVPQVLRIPFVVDMAVEMLKDAGQLVLVGAKLPVAFFGYPGKPSLLYQEGTPMTRLANVEDDIIAALAALEAELGAQNSEMAHVAEAGRPDKPSGEPTLDNLAAVMGNMLPEGAIVVDGSVHRARVLPGNRRCCPPRLAEQQGRIHRLRHACRHRCGGCGPRPVKSCCSKATAAACTPFNRFGRWLARTST